MYTKTILARYDVHLIKELANIGVNGLWGYDDSVLPPESLRIIQFDVSKLEEVDAAILQHDAVQLERAKVAKLDQLAFRRREKELTGPMGLTLDATTQNRITGAAVLLMLDTERQYLRWEISRGQFQDIPRAQVLGLAVASGAHIQACFEVVSVKTDLIKAAESLEELEAIDLESGWPT